MIPFIKPILPSVERYEKYIHKMHDNCWFSNGGEFVTKFEKDLQAYLQTDREIVVVSNATIGLMIALKSLEITKPVLVPSFTFAATIGATSWCNLEYEYVDIDNRWCMSPKATEAKLKTGKYGAIMPVHTFGLPCDVRRFERLAQQYNVKLIFDAAAAIGGMVDHQHVGNFGDIEVFSLHATKCLPIGEGGFLSIKDKDIADRVRDLKNFGFSKERSAYVNGLNGKMPEIEAAVGIEALKDLPQHMRNRRGYVAKYKKLIGDKIQFQSIPSNKEHGYQILGALVKEDADMIVKKMEKEEICLRRYYAPPVHKQEVYRKDIIIPNTNRVSEHVICLPLYSVMDDLTIEVVCDKLRGIL